MIATNIGQTTQERITIRGRDLADDLIGHADFVDMMVLTACDRFPTSGEKAMLNAVMVSVMDHGFTPSSMAARLTYLGAPEAPQAAVAAGLLGAGSVFLGVMSNTAEMLADAVRSNALTEDSTDAEIDAAAQALVTERRERKQRVFGVGHNIHSGGDPRVPRLREVACANGAYDRHWRLLDAVERVLPDLLGKPLPINGAGASGACMAALTLPLTMARGVALVARTAGLVAHLIEEETEPIGKDLWDLVLAQDPRNQHQERTLR